jgi:hypothetical protein
MARNPPECPALRNLPIAVIYRVSGKEIAMPQVRSRQHKTDSNIVQKWQHSWPSEWKVFTPFVIPGQATTQYFLGYNQSSGAIVIARLSNTSGLHVSFPQISPQVMLPPGLNNLVAFIGQPYFLYQRQDDPSATFAEVVPGDKPNSLTLQTWPTDILPSSGQLVPIMYHNQPWVVAYDGSQLSLYQIDPAKKVVSLRSSQEWGSGWTAFAPVWTDSYFICLKASTKALRAGQIDPGGAEPVVISSDLPDPLPHAWDALSSLASTNGPTFLAYAQNSTIAPQIYTMQWGPPLSITPHSSQDWPLDTSSITTFSFSALESAPEYYLISQQMSTATQAVSSVLVTICSGVKPGYPDT